MSYEAPGSVLEHRWITDSCRAQKGDEGALDEALESAKSKAAHALSRWPADRGMKIHVVVTLERPLKEGP